jgi:hypothetical protein
MRFLSVAFVVCSLPLLAFCLCGAAASACQRTAEPAERDESVIAATMTHVSLMDCVLEMVSSISCTIFSW